MFEELYKHEVFVSNAINELVHIALTEKDYASHNFYNGSSQNKLKKKQKKNILDKIHLIGDDKGGLYLFDRDIQQPNGIQIAILFGLYITRHLYSGYNFYKLKRKK
jgi:ferritin